MAGTSKALAIAKKRKKPFSQVLLEELNARQSITDTAKALDYSVPHLMRLMRKCGISKHTTWQVVADDNECPQ